jgi:hypothetical protein
MKTPPVHGCPALAVGIRIPRLNQVSSWTIEKNIAMVRRTDNWVDLRFIKVN